jgi:hypothetical protein
VASNNWNQFLVKEDGCDPGHVADWLRIWMELMGGFGNSEDRESEEHRKSTPSLAKSTRKPPFGHSFGYG